MRFDKKVVIITGGGAGMGSAAALAFAKEGAYVLISDIDEAGLNDTTNEIQSAGGIVTAIKGDVTQSECVNAVVGKALEQYDKIDILFNYVGGTPGNAPPQPFIEQTEAMWDGFIQLNIKTALSFSRAVLDCMIKQKYGKIINQSSMAGRVGLESMVLYSAVKGAIIAFTKALAREVAQYNINVNCICPGAIDTPGLRAVFRTPDLMEALIQNLNSPIKRAGLSEEVASAVLFLASDEAAFITGQVLSVDGGATMI